MGALTTGVVLAILLIAALWIFQRRLIYFPFGDVPDPRLVGLAAAEPVVFPTTDGLRLHGWLVPPLEPRAGATILVFNGNAGHRGFRATLAAALRERGYGVLLFDYRGYGGNPGTPTEDRARRGCAGGAGLPPRPPGGRGHAPGVLRGIARQRRRHAARRGAPAGGAGAALAVHLDDGRRRLPLSAAARALAADAIASTRRVASPASAVPLLVVAGDQDTVVPYAQSRRVFDAAAEPKRFVTIAGADHNDPALADGPDLIEAIDRFLKTMPVP